MQKKKGFILILFFVHFQKWLIAVATLPYIVQPVQKVMENGGAMENVNGKMDNAYTLIVSIYCYCYRTPAIISRGLYTFLRHFQRPFMYCDL